MSAHDGVGGLSWKEVLKKHLMLVQLVFILIYCWVKCNELSFLFDGYCEFPAQRDGPPLAM